MPRRFASSPGLIHATVVLHGEKGPWSNRPGFDWCRRPWSLYDRRFSNSAESSRQLPVADNVVGWLGTTGILAALRRRAIEGGSYRVVVSLTGTVLWLLSLAIFEKAYAKSTAGSTDEHTEIARRSCLVGHARRGSTTKPTDSLKFGR